MWVGSLPGRVDFVFEDSGCRYEAAVPGSVGLNPEPPWGEALRRGRTLFENHQLLPRLPSNDRPAVIPIEA
jgi:hypothetical protein